MNEHPVKHNVAFITLGCKINQYDSNSMAAELKAAGHNIVKEKEAADVIIINTCTVTGRTNYKGRQQVRRIALEHPDAVLIVTGCYAQVQAGEIADIAGVDYIIGNPDKFQIASLVSASAKQSLPEIIVSDVSREESLDGGPLEAHSGTTRAFLKIQDGCNHSCAYCIIPRARGRSRSLEPAVIKEKIYRLASDNFKEVVLCGIHLGVYGHDLSPSTSLLALLRELEEKSPLPRVRISSIEPNEVNDQMLDLFAGAKHLCPHFHLPLQSGDDTILKKMNRSYEGSFFSALVDKIKGMIPQAAIGVDVISGFPGEDDQAFRNTMALLEKMPVSYFHVFPYSTRPGTAAAGFPDQVSPELVHKRAALLRKLGQEKRLAFYRQFLSKRVEILVETTRDPETGMLKGISRNYIQALFNGPDDVQNRCIPLWISKIQGRHVIGKIKNNE